MTAQDRSAARSSRNEEFVDPTRADSDVCHNADAAPVLSPEAKGALAAARDLLDRTIYALRVAIEEMKS